MEGGLRGTAVVGTPTCPHYEPYGKNPQSISSLASGLGVLSVFVRHRFTHAFVVHWPTLMRLHILTEDIDDRPLQPALLGVRSEVEGVRPHSPKA